MQYIVFHYSRVKNGMRHMPKHSSNSQPYFLRFIPITISTFIITI